MLRFLLLLITLNFLAGCSALQERHPVPKNSLGIAIPSGIAKARIWGDEVPGNIDANIKRKIHLMIKSQKEILQQGKPISMNFLALSGGADKGAFGAGLLVGWSHSGTRPEFDLVTGVSTGALMAPFAFLGSRYDPILKEIYTRYKTSDLLVRMPLAGLTGMGSALYDTAPLKRLIVKYFDRPLLAAIARESARGRTLLVSTTNLDAQRPVIWDMGVIASSGAPGALDLFRQILLAATSIPGEFPPVLINVEANGKTFEEMHVDGGATSEVFLIPSKLSLAHYDHIFPTKVKRHLYIIRNGHLEAEWKPTRASLLPIAHRSINTLIKNQAIGDLLKLYVAAKRDSVDYNLLAIPSDFHHDKKEPFDLLYMKALFNRGYQSGLSHRNWMKTPPGFTIHPNH